MTARALDISTFILPDVSVQSPGFNPMQLPKDLGYEVDYYTNVQTLSSNLGIFSTQDLQGLLYVPSIATSSACYNQSMQYISENVTRRADIPTGVRLVALAPWFSETCTKEYLNATMADIQYVRSLIFYQVDDTSTDKPPPVSNAMWGLNDGGRWKSDLKIPAYAIPGPFGANLMHELTVYSGNVTTVPHGAELEPYYGPSGLVRLYLDIEVTNGPSLPSLWVFLIITLGILIAMVSASSLFMGAVQRRRRAALRQRVENGEVDLETLGIKRVTVPKDQLDKMPIFVFGAQRIPSPEPLPTKSAETKEALVKEVSVTEVTADSNTAADTPLSTTTVPAGSFYSQTTCAICLEDFVINNTPVRELPCHHIFHPECVDNFLLEHTSACPVCKKSSLPTGYCPAVITNAMVRREILMRRVAERNEGSNARVRERSTRGEDQMAGFSMGGRGIGIRRSNQSPMSNQLPMELTMVTRASPTTSSPTQPSAVPSSPAPNRRFSMLSPERDTNRRREAARQRAIASLEDQNAAVEQDIEAEERRLPFWRRAIGKVFPGLSA